MSTYEWVATALNCLVALVFILMAILIFKALMELIKERAKKQSVLLEENADLEQELSYRVDECDRLEQQILQLKEENKQLAITIVKSRNRENKTKKSWMKQSRKEVKNYVKCNK